MSYTDAGGQFEFSRLGAAREWLFYNPVGALPWALICYRIGMQARLTADSATKHLFPSANIYDVRTPSDAVVHCIWHCEITRAFGANCSSVVGTGHEIGCSEGLQEAARDDWNNLMGRLYALLCDESCPQACMNALRSGRLAF